MDFEFTPEEKAYQKELSEFLKREVTEEVTAETNSMQGLGPYGKDLLRKLGERRLLTPSWPEEYGGRGLTSVTQVILFDEMAYHQAPWPLDGIVIGPTLLRFGSDSQKEKYLPGIARGEIEFALGYTEPEAGSDLAAVELRAVANGDEYILNGQKVFNTEAHYADYHWLLARTDTSVPKHKGISMFIVDLKTPGITIRPLTTSAGLRTNEVFYEDVRVSKGNIVGEENRGWDYAASALGFERIMPGVVYMDHGARYDPIVPGELDRGGAINTISPRKTTSKNTTGMASSGYLVEVERVDLGELMKKYPEAFKRPYHPAAGLRMERVLVGGE